MTVSARGRARRMDRVDDDTRHMQLALRLAARGRGHTRPNPLVGAVVCDRKGNVLATGWHKRAGSDHAEVAALRKLNFRAPGATLYVNLEPCNHHGRTPPCTDAIIAAKISRVVMAMRDPYPLVDGRGLRRLRAAGITCEVGLLAHEAERLNQPFVSVMSRGRPYVTLKLAQTLDGKLATRTGDSRWVTGPEARQEVHRMRSLVDAVMVGAKTVLTDDPLLTVRPANKGSKRRVGQNPERIILDGNLSISPAAKVLPAWILCAPSAPRKKARVLEAAGARVIEVAEIKPGRIDLNVALGALAQLGVQSLLVEGGGETAAALLEADLVDRLVCFFAPKIVGGREAIPAVGGQGVATMADALLLGDVRLRQIGQDVMISGDVHRARRRNRPRALGST